MRAVTARGLDLQTRAGPLPGANSLIDDDYGRLYYGKSHAIVAGETNE